MERAIGYIRVSTEKQASEGVSLQMQQEKIEAYCLLQGLDLACLITDDGVSGAVSLENRPGGKTLQKAIRDAKAKNIVALKLDRLFRDAADALQQTREWEKAGIALHLIDMGGATINTGSAMGRMFLTMMAGFAELERNLIAERTSLALQSKKARGEVYSPIPLGFQEDAGKLVPDEREMSIVRSVRDMRNTGKSLREIAAALNEAGVSGKKQGRYFASTIRSILKNSAVLNS